MKLSKIMGAFVVTFMLTAGATTAYADLCKNVTFTFTNRHSLNRTIKVDKVDYWDTSDSTWRTEDIVPDRECTINAKCTTSPEDLEHVENEVIEKIRFIYKELVGDNWSSNITGGEKRPLDQTTECQEGRNYNSAPDGFIITGVPGPKPGQSEETVYPTAVVDTKCGGKLGVFASDSPFGLAASRVAARLPSFNAAQKANNPSFFDAHPSGITATGHGELKGFGVTMVQGKWPKPVENASGDLADPTLLFFEKTGKDQDDWKLIGMGYSFKFDIDNERPPTKIVDPGIWWIHEAGYHRSPGDGGFTCASNDDLRRSVFDAGKRVDQTACFGIDRDDLKTREFHVDQKHGRYWVLHVWFEPKTLRPTISRTDPWCRQGDDAVVVSPCAFFKQGQC